VGGPRGLGKGSADRDPCGIRLRPSLFGPAFLLGNQTLDESGPFLFVGIHSFRQQQFADLGNTPGLVVRNFEDLVLQIWGDMKSKEILFGHVSRLGFLLLVLQPGHFP